MRIQNLLSIIVFSTAIMLTIPASAQEGQGGGQDFKVDLNINGCQFSGGSDDYGNVVVQKNSGSKKIQVEVLYADDFTVETPVFSGVGADQMRATPSGKIINIFNANTGPADVYYEIKLKHNSNPSLNITCDPKIVNQ
jgi:hypothetical protein